MGKVVSDLLKGEYPTDLKACHVEPIQVMDRHARSESSMRWYGSSRVKYIAGQIIDPKHADFPQIWQRCQELLRFLEYYPAYQPQVDDPLTMETAEQMIKANIFKCTNPVIQNKMLMEYIKLMGKTMARDDVGSSVDHAALAAALDEAV